MRFESVHIDGYGRFSEKAVQFEPGLQVILGPNEQGKSTLRAFIIDVLYGQKLNAAGVVYAPSHEQRKPWQEVPEYGGRLTYALDSGARFQASRVFTRERESVRVVDLGSGEDITHTFGQLMNFEVDFAAAHLGLGKEVFQNAATISHFSLEDLGGADAVEAMQRQLRALTETGTEPGGERDALALLAARVERLGQAGARGGLIPEWTARRNALRDERAAAEAAQDTLRALTARRRSLQEQRAALRGERAQLDAQLQGLEQRGLAERLAEAESVQARIDELTQACFVLNHVRSFPAQRTHEVREAESGVATQRIQIERTRAELKQTRARLDAEAEQRVRAMAPDEIPEESEQRLEHIQAQLAALRERLAADEAAVQESREKEQAIRASLSELPDFSRFSPAPVEWINQLSTSFEIATRARDAECGERDTLLAEVERLRAETDTPRALFQGITGFSNKVREYDLNRRMHEEQVAQQRGNLVTLESTAAEFQDQIPGFTFMAIFCGIGCAVLVAAAIYTGQFGILLPGALAAVASLYFTSKLTITRGRAARVAQTIDTLSRQIEVLETGEERGDVLVERLLAESGCETVRELEAQYEAFRSASAELARAERALDIQEAKAEEASGRVPELLRRFQETFAKLGETIETEEDVPKAAGQAIARYQEYRDIKRQLADARAARERHQAQHRRLSDDVDFLLMDRDAIAADLRQAMVERGFTAESERPDILDALRAYRRFLADFRENKGRIALLEEKEQALAAQLEAEDAELTEKNQALLGLLREFGAESLDHFNVLVEQAAQYAEHRERLSALEEQQASLLRGESLDTLRMRLGGGRGDALESDGDAGAIKDRLKALSGQLDELDTALEDVQRELLEHANTTRPLVEIDEDIAAADGRLEQLHHERDATAYAMAVLDEVSGAQRARLAPRLAERASGYLRDITGGAYDEVVVGPGLEVEVRIPQTGALDAAPEQTLSKGAIDQVYLALRLALVQALSERQERIPMLLDDPFANYDDGRLAHTMALMAGLGAEHQILLFTCRDDVARAAGEAGAPVITL